MPKAIMMGITYHSADPTDSNNALVQVTFRFLGTTDDLGTLDTNITVTPTDTAATVTTKVQNAVIARAAEFGATLAASDLIPLNYGVPESLMSAANSSTMLLTDNGTDQVLQGSLGQVRVFQDWWFNFGLGIGTFAAAPYGLTVKKSSDGPIGMQSLGETTGSVPGLGALLQAQSDIPSAANGALTAAQISVVPRGTSKSFGSPHIGVKSTFQGQGTDATSSVAKFQAFAAPDVGGDPFIVTDWIGFEQEVQTTYGTNVWGIRTANRAEFSSPSAKATTVLLLRQLATGATAGAHINMDSKAGDPPSPNAGDVWRNGDEIKFRDSGATRTLFSSTVVGFYGGTPVTQQAGGKSVTNNVTVGGTADQGDDFSTSLYTSAGPTIRDNIYQLWQKLDRIADGLRAVGLLGNS